MTWRGSTNSGDRFLSCLPYLLPLIDSLAFGQSLFEQFPVLGQIILIPLMPLLEIMARFRLAEFIIFLALYILVVRNENILHFIRFNTMQALLFGISLSLCSLAFPILFSGIPIPLLAETLNSTVFLGILAAFVYSIIKCATGAYPEFPFISDAAYMQVR